MPKMIIVQDPFPVLLAVLLLAGPLLAPPAGAQTEADLSRYIETTGEILQNASDVVMGSESSRAHRILEEARRLDRRSRDLALAGYPGRAFLLSRRAREGARQAVLIARESRALEDRVRLRLERYREFRDQTIDRIAGADNEMALRFLSESEQQAHRAEDQFQQGNFALALQLIETAEAMLGRAARLLYEEGGGVRLEQELERTREFLVSVAERLDAGPEDQDARSLLASAREALLRAEDQQAGGHPLRCLRSLRLARRLAGQAVASAGDAIDPRTVADQLERWDRRHDEIAERIRDSGPRPAIETLRRAEQHRERAEALLEAEEREQALRQLRAAFDLLGESADLSR